MSATYILAIVIAISLIIIIYKQVEEYQLQDDPILHVLKQVLKDVHPGIENIEIYKGDKSYTINKKKVFLCTRDRNDEYYSLSTLIYVTLHEYAHILCKSIGHTEEFQRIFDTLLAKAKSLGVYNPNIPIPPDYCT